MNHLNKRGNIILELHIMDGEKYFKINFLAISFQMAIEFGTCELSQSLATPFKEKGNKLRVIESSETWCCFYESQIFTKLSKCIWRSSLGNPLNYPKYSSILNITNFSSKLFARICGPTILKLKPFNWDIVRSANDQLFAFFILGWFCGVTVVWIICHGLLSFFPVSLAGLNRR